MLESLSPLLTGGREEAAAASRPAGVAAPAPLPVPASLAAGPPQQRRAAHHLAPSERRLLSPPPRWRRLAPAALAVTGSLAGLVLGRAFQRQTEWQLDGAPDGRDGPERAASAPGEDRLSED
jgi:hypothetical protein